MKKINIIKKNQEFNEIIKKRNSVSSNFFIINIIKNEDNIPKFGISISHKLTNAVNRNKIKRQIKDIIDKNKNIYHNNLNYIIIIKKEALTKPYALLSENLIILFSKIKGEIYEKDK